MMNSKAKKWISLISVVCILSALLAGCSGDTEIEVVQTETQPLQGTPPDMQQPAEMPEMQSAQISEDAAAALVQAALDAVAEESELWSVTEITDPEVLTELMQGQGGRERPEGEAFEGEAPENMTTPEGKFGERPDGGMPDGTVPQWDGEEPPEGTFPEGGMPEGGQGRGEGGGRQPGNRGGAMPGLALVIANAEGAAIAVEDVLAEIGAAAEALDCSTVSMEITQEQAALLEIPGGYTGSRLVLVSARMPETENAAG